MTKQQQKKIDESLKGYRTFSPKVDELVARFVRDKSDKTAAELRKLMKAEAKE